MAPSIRPKAFVVPSIVIDPGTPKGLPKKMPFNFKQEAPKDIPSSAITDLEIKPKDMHDHDHDEKSSRRFSKLPPAPRDSPNAKTVGHFAVIPTLQEEDTHEAPSGQPEAAEIILTPVTMLDLHNEKSRRFSQLPPASSDSPNAVKLGSKFTMIPRDAADEK